MMRMDNYDIAAWRNLVLTVTLNILCAYIISPMQLRPNNIKRVSPLPISPSQSPNSSYFYLPFPSAPSPQCLNCIASCWIWYFSISYVLCEGRGSVPYHHTIPQGPTRCQNKKTELVRSHSIIALLLNDIAWLVSHVVCSRGNCYC